MQNLVILFAEELVDIKLQVMVKVQIVELAALEDVIIIALVLPLVLDAIIVQLTVIAAQLDVEVLARIIVPMDVS